MSRNRDKIFAKKRSASNFHFGKETASVFDDMLDRSVPFYAEMQRMMGEIAADFAVKGTNVYDLGCSTGTTLLALDRMLPKGVRFIGLDSSQDMLDRGREKLNQFRVRRPVDLVKADLNAPLQITNASVVVMALTLQFVRPLYRQRLMESISRGLKKGGCLILIEKVLSGHTKLDRLFIKYYCGFKQRQGYSQLEIAQKREALENVLIPYRVEENRELLLRSGFSECELFFKWYNFCGIVALK